MQMIQLTDEVFEKLSRLAKAVGCSPAKYVSDYIEHQADWEFAGKYARARELIDKALVYDEWLDETDVVIAIDGDWDRDKWDVREALSIAVGEGWVETSSSGDKYRRLPPKPSECGIPDSRSPEHRAEDEATFSQMMEMGT